MTKIWAHRGASGYAPENTMEAFRLADRMKADGIELDVQLTKDREVIVLHDEVIDRVSNGKGYVKNYTLSELEKFNFAGKHPEYKDVRIPTLREVLAFAKKTSMTVNIELKTGVFFYEGLAEKTIALVKEAAMEDRVIYSSFNHYTIRDIKNLDPQAKTGLLYADGYIDMPVYGAALGVDALHPALYNLQYPDFLRDCRKKHLKVHVWTVNKEKYMKKMYDMGVDAIITNYPDKARNVKERMRKEDPHTPHEFFSR